MQQPCCSCPTPAWRQCCRGWQTSPLNCSAQHEPTAGCTRQPCWRSAASWKVHSQRHLDGMLQWLGKHGQHVAGLKLTHDRRSSQPSIFHLPQSLQRLVSLELGGFAVQLQPGGVSQAVLGAVGSSLKQLLLDECTLLGDKHVLASALSLLPALQHLSIRGTRLAAEHEQLVFPEESHQPQQLTCLELRGVQLRLPAALQQLTGLQELLVDLGRMPGALKPIKAVTADMLSGLSRLTCLTLAGLQGVAMRPGILHGKTALQHLCVLDSITHSSGCMGAAAPLLSDLQQLQQLTYLDLSLHSDTLHHINYYLNVPRSRIQTAVDPMPPAAAYAALTTSSKLQHLNISCCQLPTGVWQHLFSPGMPLPHLRVLNISNVKHPGGSAAAPEGISLASCCPRLQSLDMMLLRYSSELLAPLTRLTGLQELSVAPAEGSTGRLEVVVQLTGLRKLRIIYDDSDPCEKEGHMLQLSRLQQLTDLDFTGCFDRPAFLADTRFTQVGVNDTRSGAGGHGAAPRGGPGSMDTCAWQVA